MTRSGPHPKDVSRCRSCGAEIVFLRSFNRKTKQHGRMPVNVVPTRAEFRGPDAGETDFKHGEHQSHFSTCPKAERFRGKR